MTRFGPVPLTPTAFLDRARVVHRDQVGLVDGDVRRTYAELGDRCERLAGALAGLGVAPGDRVSLLAPNTGVALEAHFGVPWSGAVLNALNTRLSAPELAWIVGTPARGCSSSTTTSPSSAGRSPSRRTATCRWW
jgi:fatty-acyl-CoA synthase